MNTVLDVLKLRRVKLDYVSPPICPFQFSGSGAGFLFEEGEGPGTPTGVKLSGVCDRFIVWDPVLDVLNMSLYSSTDNGKTFSLLIDAMPVWTVAVITPGYWSVAAVGPDGEGTPTPPVFVDGTHYVFLSVPYDGRTTGIVVYKNPDITNSDREYVKVLDIVGMGSFEINSNVDCFAIQAISDDGSSNLSETVCASSPTAGCFPTFACPPEYFFDLFTQSCVGDDLSEVLFAGSDYCIGPAYSSVFTAVGGLPPYSWAVISGITPPGLTLDPGPSNNPFTTFSGNPTAGGVYVFTVQVTDRTGMQRSLTVAISGLEFVTASPLPNATTDTPYSTSIVVTGGTPPYTFSAVTALPGGLTMDAAGQITGNPMFDGSPTFDVSVTDSNGLTCQKTYGLTIYPCPDPQSFPVIPAWLNLGAGDTVHIQAFDPEHRRWWMAQDKVHAGNPVVSIVNTVSNSPGVPAFSQYASYFSPYPGGIEYHNWAGGSHMMTVPSLENVLVLNKVNGTGKQPLIWYNRITNRWIGVQIIDNPIDTHWAGITGSSWGLDDTLTHYPGPVIYGAYSYAFATDTWLAALTMVSNGPGTVPTLGYQISQNAVVYPIGLTGAVCPETDTYYTGSLDSSIVYFKWSAATLRGGSGLITPTGTIPMPAPYNLNGNPFVYYFPEISLLVVLVYSVTASNNAILFYDVTGDYSGTPDTLVGIATFAAANLLPNLPPQSSFYSPCRNRVYFCEFSYGGGLVSVDLNDLVGPAWTSLVSLTIDNGGAVGNFKVATTDKDSDLLYCVSGGDLSVHTF